MTKPIYEDPMGHRTQRRWDHYPPSGCGVCGVQRRDHYGRWSKTHGWHGWRQPTDEQIKFRMLHRRQARLALDSLQKVLSGLGWTSDLRSGEPRVTTLTMADMSVLSTIAAVDGVDVLGFYIGGDTPNVPTLAQVKAVSPRYRLPIFTRSDPQNANVNSDVNAALTQLQKLGAPTGITVGLDLETAVNPTYVSAFSNLMSLHGYDVLAYGSKSTLFRNPETYAGYWVADYTNTPHLYPGTVATQYADAAMAHRAYDLSVISAAVKLWDTIMTAHPGASGDPHTAVLQELLNELGNRPELAVDGQKGSLTKLAFARLIVSYGTIEHDDTGSGVKLVQAMLNTWWLVVTTPSLAIDGDFGSATLAAVKDFQLARKIEDGANGQVGNFTKAALAV